MAPPSGVMVCLPSEEERAREVMRWAARLADELKARLCVVHICLDRVDPRHQAWAKDAAAISWFIDTKEPVPALLNRVRLDGVTHIILGPRAWRAWGKSLRSACARQVVHALGPGQVD